MVQVFNNCYDHDSDTMKILTPHRGTEAVPACGPPKEIKFLTCLIKRDKN